VDGLPQGLREQGNGACLLGEMSSGWADLKAACGPKVFPGPSWASRRGRWPSGGHASMKPGLSSRACGARPSAGWTSQGGMALREKPRDNAQGGFLGGARSPRPDGEAVRMPRHFIPTRCDSRAGHGAGPSKGHASVKPGLLRACGARPSRGQAWVRGLAGKPGDDARGGFLGGTHSVRPPGKAVRMPRHFIPTRCVAERAGPSRDMPR
jgi:hypothetical protein